jgi:hypothetical protein
VRRYRWPPLMGFCRGSLSPGNLSFGLFARSAQSGKDILSRTERGGQLLMRTAGHRRQTRRTHGVAKFVKQRVGERHRPRFYVDIRSDRGRTDLASQLSSFLERISALGQSV